MTYLLKSLAYRLPNLYRRLLSNRKIYASKKPIIEGIVLLSMTGEKHLDLLKYSMWSIANSWSKLPDLFVYNDGSLENYKISKKLTFWKNELHINSWEICKEYHKRKNRTALINYANADPFGKKLALILYHASVSPTIWIDNDILFYQDFIRLLPQTDFQTELCGGCEDWTTGYQKEVIKFYPILSEFKNFNAGLLYISGIDFYEKYNLEELLSNIHPHYDFFTEQSIFAKIASESLGKFWSKEIILNFNTDKQHILPMDSKNCIARHYTSNVRHLFWRDLFLNFTKIKF